MHWSDKARLFLCRNTRPRATGSRRWWFRVALTLAFLGGAAPARAQFLYKRVALPYLVERAATIVQGRVAEVRYEGHPDYPNVPTVFVRLEVERMLRGTAREQFSFRQYVPQIELMRGKPEYAVGQRLLLFMPAPSRYALSSPLAREQGRFRIWRDRQGRELVENGHGNAGLFRNVAETAAKRGARLTPTELRVASTPRGPVPLEDLISLINQLSPQADTR